MTKEEILQTFSDINYAYNNCSKYDTLKRMLDELTEPCDDAISRAWLKEAIHNFYYGLKHTPTEEDIQAYIDAAPPVTPKQKMGRWIPVSERLPEPFSYVNCTCHSLIDDREDWVVETVYLPQPPDSPYSDWGNIPMLNWGECEVIAWMYRDIPEPYKAESEDEK